MNIEQELKEMEAKIAAIRAEMAKPAAPEIDWERVIREKYLVEAKDRDDQSWVGPGLLSGFDRKDTAAPFRTPGSRWVKCRLYTGPNVFIPHFGGPCPVAPDTKVVVRYRSGIVEQKRAEAYYWEHNNDYADIMDYMVVGN